MKHLKFLILGAAIGLAFMGMVCAQDYERPSLRPVVADLGPIRHADVAISDEATSAIIRIAPTNNPSALTVRVWTSDGRRWEPSGWREVKP